MSKRLQVLLPDQEMEEIRQFANRERLSVGEWVRRTLREGRADKPSRAPDVKIMAVRRATELSLPTAHIEQMLGEIERGYHD